MGRALRVLFTANDGFSVGHVTRTLAIARALHEEAKARAIELQGLLVTTSEAHSLVSSERSLAVVRLPPPARARDAGFSDADRRRLVRGTIEGVAQTFAPDLIVVDTFPSGPHGELAGLIATTGAKLALVRRNVPKAKEDDETLAAGFDRYHRVIVADDPTRRDAEVVDDFLKKTRGREVAKTVVRVSPITSVEPSQLLDRDVARLSLGLPSDGRIVLVLAGGGGDREAVSRARAIAEEIPKIDPSIHVMLGLGPLSNNTAQAHRLFLATTFKAFDGAIAPAGYNTAMELTMAGVPTAFYAQPRPFDDQLGRAQSLENHGLALAFERDVFLERALAWMKNWSPPQPNADLKWGGAGEVAKVLLDLVAGGGS
jgi:UDP-N-acetylglucosamine--N-acetylmuramyl-(pentapeptide) pyrophosphoryl-undecaprenol N-acetylglucosamine transferase